MARFRGFGRVADTKKIPDQFSPLLIRWEGGAGGVERGREGGVFTLSLSGPTAAHAAFQSERRALWCDEGRTRGLCPTAHTGQRLRDLCGASQGYRGKSRWFSLEMDRYRFSEPIWIISSQEGRYSEPISVVKVKILLSEHNRITQTPSLLCL